MENRSQNSVAVENTELAQKCKRAGVRWCTKSQGLKGNDVQVGVQLGLGSLDYILSKDTNIIVGQGISVYVVMDWILCPPKFIH